ncbi:MAG: class I SAM-dependent methyltransferase [Gammaproteobacteria bacterium]
MKPVDEPRQVDHATREASEVAGARAARVPGPEAKEATGAPFLEAEGVCPTCDRATRFVSPYEWLRDHFTCVNCGSVPRERALMATIERWLPDWRDRRIHESSPLGRGASVKLAGAAGYSASHYVPALPTGTVGPSGLPNENLEGLSFPDETFDLVVTQDVMEHVFEPSRAFAEIARVLRTGGLHVFTTPLVAKARPSERRARRAADGAIEHLAPPEYHGNPVDPNGSLVTFHWGYYMTSWSTSGAHVACRAPSCSSTT